MRRPLKRRTRNTKTQQTHLPPPTARMTRSTDRTLLNMEDIWDFITTVDIADVSDILDRQIRYNSAIAEEGLRGDYGATSAPFSCAPAEMTSPPAPKHGRPQAPTPA